MLEGIGALRLAFAGNLLLTAIKVGVGLLTGSAALFADGIHSLTDVLSTVIAWAGARLGGLPADEDHPYGHGGAENVAAVAVAGVMVWTAYQLMVRGIVLLQIPQPHAPEAAAAVVALAAAGVKEALHRQAAREAERTRSPAVDALAKDHRSDVLSSLAAFLGVLGARFGNPDLDPVASLAIAALILQNAWETFRENLDALMDREPDLGALKAALMSRAGSDPEIVRLRTIRAHQVGPQVHLQIDLEVDPAMSVARAHVVAHRIEAWARELDARVASAQLHVEPAEPAAAAPSRSP